MDKSRSIHQGLLWRREGAGEGDWHYQTQETEFLGTLYPPTQAEPERGRYSKAQVTVPNIQDDFVDGFGDHQSVSERSFYCAKRSQRLTSYRIATIIAPNRVIETLGAKIDILALTMTTSLSQHSPKLNRSMSNTDTLVGFSKNTIPENDSSDNPPPYLNTAARNEALREAAKTGDVATLSSLIAQGVNINQRDASGATALHYATSCGHDEAVAVLLACVNVNVNAANEEGYSPLHLACRRGYHQIVGILLTSEKINVDLQNNMQETALHHAAYHGFSGCVKELLGSANTCLLNKSGEMALHLASYHGHTNCVRLLLSSKDAQADGRNAWQESALHLAVANGKIATAEVLMVHCAPDSKDGEGKTPLHLAVMKKHEEIVKLLLRNASPDCVNAYGQSPRDMARFGGSASMMHLFNAGNDGVKVASMVEVLDITAEVY